MKPMNNLSANEQPARYHVGYVPDYAIAPGDVLEEHREAAAMTQAELADRLGLSVKHVNRVIAGLEPVTPETALRLESVFGLPAHVWLGLESRYREVRAREAESESLTDETEWLKRIPHKSLVKLGWIESTRDRSTLVRSLREFYRVGSLNYLPNVWRSLQARYRKTPAFAAHEWALVAWLAQGERKAERIACKPFDGAALKASLPEIKALSRLPNTEFVEPLLGLCAEHGVALVMLPTPEGGRVCGATRWLTADKVLVQLSLRYKTDDQLWFTLFHELGHVLLHKKNTEYVDFEGGDKDEMEREADAFAMNTLVDQKTLSAFIAAGMLGASSIQSFAREQGVAPGIVLGQLQHLKIVRYATPLNRLKRGFEWSHEQRR